MFNKFKVEGLIAMVVAVVGIAGVSANAVAAPQEKVYVCHKDSSNKEKSIRINGNALQAHMNHGDLPGKCGEIILSEWLDLRCDSAPESGVFSVSNISFSEGVSAELQAIVAGSDCAVAQKTVQDANCRLAKDYGTPDAQVYVFNCPGPVVVPE
ncbi:MAG: hypothetical protein ACR2QW_08560 [bacterium]